MATDLALPLDGVLQLGAHGPHVLRVQRRLNELMDAGLRANGAYDLHTMNAVRAWQARERLDRDGRVGRRTARSLGFTRYVERHAYRRAQAQALAGHRAPRIADGPLHDVLVAVAQAAGLIEHKVLAQLAADKHLLGGSWEQLRRTVEAAHARALRALEQLARGVMQGAEAVESGLRRIFAALRRDITRALAEIARSNAELAAAFTRMQAHLSRLMEQVWRVIRAVLKGIGGVAARRILDTAERGLRGTPGAMLAPSPTALPTP